MLHKRYGKNIIIPLCFILSGVWLAFLLINTLPVRADSTAKAVLTNAVVKSVADGTAPFDKDNEKGHDDGASNGIVRSFDTINYTLEYVTAINGNETLNEARLMVEFRLPCSKDQAQFNMESMNWMRDAKVVEKDGVQILTGYRLLQNANGATMIPGAGTLSVGVSVKSAPNGLQIKPDFTLWMEGNSDNEKIHVDGRTTTVSAKPSYDFHVIYNTGSEGDDFLGYFNEKSGACSDVDSDGTIYGRQEGIGLGFAIRGNENGMKGIEYPQGDISFDVRLSSSLDQKDVSYDPSYQPVLWDYYENEGYMPYPYKGKLGRDMLYTVNTSTGLNWRAPVNEGGGKYGCYNGGKYAIVQDQSDPNVYHVTIKDYQLDTENYKFPTHKNHPDIPVETNVYYVSVGYMQIIAQFPRTVNTTSNYYVSAEMSDFHAASLSDDNSGANIITTNDKWTNTITLYPSGSWYHGNSYEGSHYTGNHNGDGYTTQDSNNISLLSMYGIEYEQYSIAANFLQKFDDEGMEVRSGAAVPASTNWYTLKVLYAAKPDKTGWTDDTEMEKYHEENMVFFDSLADLKKNGYTCVGYLYEIRNFKMKRGWINLGMPMHFLKTAVLGNVYKTVNDARIWLEGSTVADSWTTMPYSGISGAYGDGRAISANPADTGSSDYYENWYSKPNWYGINQNYQKTIYQNGQILPGSHSGGYLNGNSILIVGDKPTIQIKNDDKNADGSEKKVYDMDTNERIATFRLIPNIGMVASDGQTDMRDAYTITVTLPDLLTYEQGSAYLGSIKIDPQSIEKNSNGTTILKFRAENQPVGKTLEEITFRTTIGNAGTTHDVANNQSLPVRATITTDSSSFPITETNGNISNTSIICIKLAAIALSKSTDTPYVNIGDTFRYTVKFANTSDVDLNNAILYDVFPYNGDGRNSDFGGSYLLENISMDFSNAPKSFADYQQKEYGIYSTKSVVKANDFNAVANVADWVIHENKNTDTVNKIVSVNNIHDEATAARLACSLRGGEYINVTITFRGIGEQHEGDVYVNNVYENAEGQSKEVLSNRASVQIYGSIPVKKIWNDSNNIYNTRPKAITLLLMQNGKQFGEPVSMKSTNSEYTFHNVPLYDREGNTYSYTVQEKGYEPLYSSELKGNDEASKNELAGREASDGFTLTNTFSPVSLKVSKIVKGSLGDRNKEFDLNIKLTYEASSFAEKKLMVSGGRYNGQIIETDKDGNLTLKLKHGDIVTINGIPASTKYEVSETHTGYKQNISGETTGTLDKDKSVSFTNERDGSKISKTVNQSSSNIGEKQVWTISADVPDDISGNSDDHYYFRIDDPIDNRLEYVGLVETPEKKYDVRLVCNDGTTEYLKENDYRTSVQKNAGNDSSDIWEIELLNSGLKKAADAVNKGLHPRFAVSYQTFIKDTIAGEHITNQATLLYGGYGNPEDPEVKRPEETSNIPYVYTADIEVKKISNVLHTAMPGAQFALSTKDKDGILREVHKSADNAVLLYGMDQYNQSEPYIMTTDNDGICTFHGLKYGDYYLTETKAPTGHSLMKEPVLIELKEDTAKASIQVNDDGNIVIATGGNGMTQWYIFSAISLLITLIGCSEARKKQKM